ncbi:hypothetical protein [Ulvibacterium sp.]|uniref:hypothetical protein n=1 Tax=Ulvibacterium sp. TaxID=2665914 RepID=UPI003BAD3709
MRLISVLFSSMIFLVNCSDDDDNGLERSDCNEVVCTLQFVTLNVTVKDPSGVVIPLDAFEVTITKTGEDITREVSGQEFETFRRNGTYPLFGDEFAEQYKNKTELINFKGFIEDQEVVNSSYKVGADCCHVLLIDGDPNIVVD